MQFGGSLRHWLAYVAAILVLSLFSVAQSNYAVISGSISDPQTHALVGANVELTATATAAVRRVVTNAQGLYEITGLQPGNYELRVTATGFGASLQTLQLEVAQRLVLDI